ncbi:MAG: hypothetical protein SPI16_03965 [Porphyromonas sp.]|uniref:hypothetical protein n=1 Tax=Porphyromonas sp. TaxID=1924944 RepID=UPI002A912461|nr:hypothetical protein [Porphyromonas sp.]MDD7468056.1 hypothetical protein [Bacteroidales bacterium]MDY6102187.1 hypothetical protein [Porphyromonas sp.]
MKRSTTNSEESRPAKLWRIVTVVYVILSILAASGAEDRPMGQFLLIAGNLILSFILVWRANAGS